MSPPGVPRIASSCRPSMHEKCVPAHGANAGVPTYAFACPAPRRRRGGRYFGGGRPPTPTEVDCGRSGRVGRFMTTIPPPSAAENRRAGNFPAAHPPWDMRDSAAAERPLAACAAGASPTPRGGPAAAAAAASHLVGGQVVGRRADGRLDHLLGTAAGG